MLIQCKRQAKPEMHQARYARRHELASRKILSRRSQVLCWSRWSQMAIFCWSEIRGHPAHASLGPGQVPAPGWQGVTAYK